MVTTLNIKATINQHIAYVKPYRSLSVNFLRRVLDNAYGILRHGSEEGGSTKGAITCEDISQLKVPVPPLKEQDDIYQHIRTMTSKIDNLMTSVQTAISLLQERRTALISAAVTGKIDVRDNLISP